MKCLVLAKGQPHLVDQLADEGSEVFSTRRMTLERPCTLTHLGDLKEQSDVLRQSGAFLFQRSHSWEGGTPTSFFSTQRKRGESRPANVNLRPRSPNTVAGPSSVMNLQAKPNSDEDSHQGWEKAPPQKPLTSQPLKPYDVLDCDLALSSPPL